MLSRCIHCKSIWVKWNITCYSKNIYFMHQCLDCNALYRTDKFVWFGLPNRFVNRFYWKFVNLFTKKCKDKKECYPICDFCTHYNFNGETIDGIPGMYVDKGFCKLMKCQKDPGDTCSRFECKKRKSKNVS